MIKFKRIADLRIDNDLTQKEIAKVLKVKEDTYSKWERGINDIPLDKINSIANFYNTSIDYILGLSDNKIPLGVSSIDINVLSAKLKQLRKDNKLSQDELSSKLEFTQRGYSNYETGKVVISTYKLFLIAKFYNISIDRLLKK